ncbi:MAG: ParB/RepB/Spo0J family partition protein [Opitutus sp.]|nr:ParB/RepB/Spo0J family partition protein [Opitutus sp.]MCS6247038.1 ParB/RepB/Spo0J family partition protein [Opitutus sp.]MCS6273112.1 ParB/RepB/Spo0J family partition protein [Opitutus sp.]MCS6278904.1 ParB/RepB/Spo0J family partition protein [Opitutus sp.]MCS6298654.1 ParB/RepB/Spo0J family partition protein [Opitutus sp.]
MCAAPKSRLGRGLGGIIAAAVTAKPPAPAPSATVPSFPGFAEIAVSLIVPSPYQARREISPAQLSELAESIRSEGLLQPIVVRKAGDKYELIAGERRWRAFQLLKIKTIPVRLHEASNASSAALGLIENLQREGLNPLEEAYGYASLIRDFDLTQEAASERVGKGRASVANALRLLSLDAELQGYVSKSIISVGHAKVLLGIEDPAQRALIARRVIEEGLSVRATEKLVQAKKAGAPAPSAQSPAVRKLAASDASAVAGIEKRLTSHFGSRVALQHTPKKGKIVIDYAGNDDLQRILEKLGIEA